MDARERLKQAYRSFGGRIREIELQKIMRLKQAYRSYCRRRMCRRLRRMSMTEFRQWLEHAEYITHGYSFRELLLVAALAYLALC